VVDAILHEPGEAEIEDVGPRVVAVRWDVEQDVAGLQIAVDDSSRVRVGKPCEDLIDRRPDDPVGQEPVVRREVDPLVQAATRRRVHDEVRRAIGEGTEVPRSHDRRVVQPREGARLFLEPPRVFGSRRLARASKELQRDALVEHEVAAQIHHAHAAATELASHLVATGEHCAGLEDAFLAHGEVRI